MQTNYIKLALKTSFSRLETYTKCPRLYWNKYVEKLDVQIPQAVPLLKGVYVHEVLAEVLNPETNLICPQEVFSMLLPAWLESQSLEFDTNFLLNFVQQFGELIHRTLLSYRGPYPIRNKDGSPPRSLQTFPPTTWKNALKDSGLTDIRYQVDNMAASQNAEYVQVSLSYLLGEIWALVAHFSKPGWIKDVIGVEMPISTDETNEVILIESSSSEEDDVLLRAYIDLVAVTEDGRRIIIDHKTSKKKPLPEEVLFHPQLNLYAWVRHETYGGWDDLLGIHHVPSGEYVLAQVDPEIVMETVRHFQILQKISEQDVAYRRHPMEYNTPCIQRDYATHQIKSVCPFLQHCWPLFFQTVSESM